MGVDGRCLALQQRLRQVPGTVDAKCQAPWTPSARHRVGKLKICSGKEGSV
jgi:hypothetical protein